MSEKPQRVQLSRAKGWRLPENAVVVSRPSRWGNPWSVGAGRVRLLDGTQVEIAPLLTAAGVVDRFRRWMLGELGREIAPVQHPLFDLVLCPGEPPDIGALRGRDLACWCAPNAPCHADVLLELANA